MAAPDAMPSVGAVLRQYMSDPAETAARDVRAEAAARSKALRTRLRRAEAAAEAARTQTRLRITDVFAGLREASGLPDAHPKLTRAVDAVRPLYTRLLEVVRRAVPDRSAGERLHAAYLVYRALSDAGQGGVRKQMEAAVGKIPNAEYAQAVDLVGQMEAWRQKHGLGPLVPAMAAREASAPAAKAPAAAAATATAGVSGGGGGGGFAASLAYRDPVEAAREAGGESMAPAAPAYSDGEDDPVRDEDAAAAAAAAGVDEESKEAGPTHGRAWMRQMLEPFATFSKLGEPLVTEHELAQSCLAVLRSRADDAAIQADLIGILGMEERAFEVLGAMLQNRARICEDHQAEETAERRGGGQRRQKQQQQQQQVSQQQQQQQQASGTPSLLGVTVKRESERRQEREARRRDKKLARMTASSGVAAAPDQGRLDEQADLLKEWRSASAKTRTGLPEGTTRTRHDGWEEVYVPPPRESRGAAEERRVPVSEFSPFAQTAFRGIKALNRMQSRVYEAAYRSNHNLLVCAPTGAGKTNVALMTVVREAEQHLSPEGVLQRDLFKVVYVAPMKALAQEVAEKFSKILAPLGCVVKELTGDMQLTKREIRETQLIVTTPEKWDVVTRKTGDGSLIQTVRLLIIDEVHLLHEERGPVLEVLVARTVRHVEASQQMCRVVGLSATLPNYADVAAFLRVNPRRGLFHFGGEFRPVPLHQRFIGVSDPNSHRQRNLMQRVCYDKAVEALKEGHQVMVFVHSRRDTFKTGELLLRTAQEESETALFEPDEAGAGASDFLRRVSSTRSSELRQLAPKGVGMHHAGMTRQDRNLVERGFKNGHLKVICCTATLAWGVNLPAHSVIIKGTSIYAASRGGWVDLSMLDVMQIFGRAGRPQFDSSGEGTIITSGDKLPHYLGLLTQQMPIESQFIKALPDHLNAEIILGTVSSLREAVEWLGYTYLFVRMVRNPMVYGVSYEERAADPGLVERRRALVEQAAEALARCRMTRYDKRSGNFFSTDVGRVASHYYIHHESVETYNKVLKDHMTDEAILDAICMSREFELIKVRDEEVGALEKLAKKYCPVRLRHAVVQPRGKVCVLLQTYISQGYVQESTLMSDLYYITQSAGRICRALFEMVLKAGRSQLAASLLRYCLMVDRRQWAFQHPLRQFPNVRPEAIARLEERRLTLDHLVEMEAAEIGQAVRQQKQGDQVARAVAQFPHLALECSVQPITRDVISVTLDLYPEFEWNSRVHGSVQPFHVWVEDDRNEYVYHHEYFLLHAQKAREPHRLTFAIPVQRPVPPQYYVRCVSDRWLGCETTLAVSFERLVMPDERPTHTELLPLAPVPVAALHSPAAERMYSFTHFNSVQTQAFHTLYHTDENVLLGAPTGSGKTVVAELAMLRMFALHPERKVVYVAPMKALARERVAGWSRAKSFAGALGMRVVELTGDSAPDARALREANILITTPEKWDGVTRGWAQRSRGYVRSVGLVVMDEIHLLGQDRGPVLEVIVSRMRFIAAQTGAGVRLLGLTTSLSNAHDLADWLGIGPAGLFNFSPDVRPVALTVHVSGFPGRHYCPRMATMNKPTYAAIMTYSPAKPVLVFVSSRRQTRLTALDLISFSAADGNPRKFLRMEEDELQSYLARVRDPNLRHMLNFGIGMHHAGLPRRDRAVVEELFVSRRILVLVCTSTLAWGVNFPAHLVVVKGTEYFDAKQGRYVDFPITDVLQMMGRAGRPQFDTEGRACVLVHEPKKNFYLKFLHSPFPVESSLHKDDHLHNHLNAEVCVGTVASVHDAVDYLTWTFFFRRLLANPSYYGLDSAEPAAVNEYLLGLARGVLLELGDAGLLSFHAARGGGGGDDADEGDVVDLAALAKRPERLDACAVRATTRGAVASSYYLGYRTLRTFAQRMRADMSLRDALETLCAASEFDELPVRHNEDKLNEELAKRLPWAPRGLAMDDAHAKAAILFQAHFSRAQLPIADYATDMLSVLDQSVRVLQAMIDVAAEEGWLSAAMHCMLLAQMVIQARWHTDSAVADLPHASDRLVAALQRAGARGLPQVMALPRARLRAAATQCGLKGRAADELERAVRELPLVSVRAEARGASPAAGAGAAVPQGSRAVVSVELRREGAAPQRVRAPRFAKPKDEGWWLVLGAGEELLALRRLSAIRRGGQTETLEFGVGVGAGERRLDVYLVSDAYVGLDQQVELRLAVE